MYKSINTWCVAYICNRVRHNRVSTRARWFALSAHRQTRRGRPVMTGSPWWCEHYGVAWCTSRICCVVVSIWYKWFYVKLWDWGV